MKYSLNTVPKRALNVGKSATCGLGAFGFYMLGGLTGTKLPFVLAAGCASSSMYMLGQAVLPEKEDKQ